MNEEAYKYLELSKKKLEEANEILTNLEERLSDKTKPSRYLGYRIRQGKYVSASDFDCSASSGVIESNGQS